jgi:hypothetical protein
VCEETRQRKLTVSWDTDDIDTDNAMAKEHHPKLEDRLDMMWIEQMKKGCGWKKGEKIYANLKSNADGYFDVWYSKNKADVGLCFDLIVEPSGYACRRYFNQYARDEDKEDGIAYEMYIRTESDYNDFICDQILDTKK